MSNAIFKQHKKIGWVVTVLLCSAGAVAQQKIDTVLKSHLDTLMMKDQQYRKLMDVQGTQKSALANQFGIPVDSVSKHLWILQGKLDSSNWKEMEAIFQRIGYPGKSLVGVPSNEVAWYILQHNPRKIQQYFPLVEEAGKKKEIPYVLVAKMLDRILMTQGKEQIYGTQAQGFTIYNSTSGKKEFQWIIWPIKDPENVNKRRKEAGFTDTVEENAKNLGASYKVLTLEDIEKLREGTYKN